MIWLCSVRVIYCDQLHNNSLSVINIRAITECKTAKTAFRKCVYSTGVGLTFFHSCFTKRKNVDSIIKTEVSKCDSGLRNGSGNRWAGTCEEFGRVYYAKHPADVRRPTPRFLQIATNCLSPLWCTWPLNRLPVVLIIASHGYFQ
jgi:hypothetical protein